MSGRRLDDPARLTVQIRLTAAPQWIRCGRIAVWPGRRLVMVDDRIVRLTAGEIALIMQLVQASGEPVSREALQAEAGWGRRRPVSRTIDTMVWSIRRKLGDRAKSRRIIITVPSSGYAIALEEMADGG